MNRWIRYFSLALILIGVCVAAVAYLQGASIPVLQPKGWVGVRQKDLIITTTLLMLVVVIPVFILTSYISWKYRKENKNAPYDPDWDDNPVAEAVWWGLPFVIIAVLAVITWRSSHELDPFRPLDSSKKPVTIQVVALQWKWLFIYPEYKIAAVNYVCFPEQTPVEFQITADAPMNAFWIPQLGSQIYAMPGMQSKLHLIADSIGTYRGVSANLSGKGFSGMTFQAESVSEENFTLWVDSVRNKGTPLDITSYNVLVQPTERVPISYYAPADPTLFETIIMKYTEFPGIGIRMAR
jgi:cytochrome o ubiquinol oxidase subunit 2